MASKLKITPFARFFMIMIILAPLAYIGASYYNGEDGIENFKNLIGLGDKKKTETTTTIIPSDTKGEGEAVLKLEDEVKYLERRIKELEQENRDLTNMLEEKEAEIESLKEGGGS